MCVQKCPKSRVSLLNNGTKHKVKETWRLLFVIQEGQTYAVLSFGFFSPHFHFFPRLPPHFSIASYLVLYCYCRQHCWSGQDVDIGDWQPLITFQWGASPGRINMPKGSHYPVQINVFSWNGSYPMKSYAHLFVPLPTNSVTLAVRFFGKRTGYSFKIKLHQKHLFRIRVN